VGARANCRRRRGGLARAPRHRCAERRRGPELHSQCWGTLPPMLPPVVPGPGSALGGNGGSAGSSEPEHIASRENPRLRVATAAPHHVTGPCPPAWPWRSLPCCFGGAARLSSRNASARSSARIPKLGPLARARKRARARARRSVSSRGPRLFGRPRFVARAWPARAAPSWARRASRLARRTQKRGRTASVGWLNDSARPRLLGEP
jgi:hypothetical protein